jgi:hypothetical protein
LIRERYEFLEGSYARTKLRSLFNWGFGSFVIGGLGAAVLYGINNYTGWFKRLPSGWDHLIEYIVPVMYTVFITSYFFMEFRLKRSAGSSDMEIGEARIARRISSLQRRLERLDALKSAGAAELIKHRSPLDGS